MSRGEARIGRSRDTTWRERTMNRAEDEMLFPGFGTYWCHYTLQGHRIGFIYNPLIWQIINTVMYFCY